MGYYNIPIALCDKRHDYYDKETKQEVKLAVFPRSTQPPSMDTKLSACGEVLKTLKDKLESFGQKSPVVNIKLYWSGADGPGEALRQALYSPPVSGFEYFALPHNWNITFMKYQPIEASYKEEKSMMEMVRRQRN